MLGQKAVCHEDRALFMENQLRSPQLISQQLVMLCIARYLVAGNPLEPVIPRVLSKDTPGQERYLGMVTTDRIGQSACLPPKCATAMHMVGRHRLNGCRWESPCVIATLPVVFLLKVQSTPCRKTGVEWCIRQLITYYKMWSKCKPVCDAFYFCPALYLCKKFTWTEKLHKRHGS